MKINIGHIKSESQFLKITLDTNYNTLDTIVVDNIQLTDSELNLLVFHEEDLNDYLTDVFDKEDKFYPLLKINNITNFQNYDFENLSYEETLTIFNELSSKWVLTNNLTTIKNISGLLTHLNHLWLSERHNFYEELWYLIKTNFNTVNLSIIFHDVEDHKNKPSLNFSTCKGKKTPEIFICEESERSLMKELEEEFTDKFRVLENNKEKNQFSFTKKIGLGPILIYGEALDINALNLSLLEGLLQGIQER